jgi:hypothetical protein
LARIFASAAEQAVAPDGSIACLSNNRVTSQLKWLRSAPVNSSVMPLKAMNNETYKDSWWLMYCDLPNLNWARLRVFPAGSAEVLDSDGKTHEFATEKAAINWLHEDEFTAFAKLNAEDEIEYGIKLSEISPPKAESDEELKNKMYVVTKDA